MVRRESDKEGSSETHSVEEEEAVAVEDIGPGIAGHEVVQTPVVDDPVGVDVLVGGQDDGGALAPGQQVVLLILGLNLAPGSGQSDGDVLDEMVDETIEPFLGRSGLIGIPLDRCLEDEIQVVQALGFVRVLAL